MLRPDTLALTALLALLTALGPVATDMYLASLPDIGRLLAAPPATVQLTLSVYLLAYTVGQVIYGPLSDSFGRRPVLITALVTYCLASLACAAAMSIETLIVARALQALGSSGAIVLARAIVRDLYVGVRAGRELSLMAAIMAIAPIAAPLAGGVLQSLLGWRANFLLMLAIGFIAVAMVWLRLPETLRAPRPASLAGTLSSYRGLGTDRAFLAYLGMLAFTFAGMFAWISGSSFVLQDLYGLSPFGFGLAFGAGCLGYLAGTSLAARIVVRLGIDATIGVGALALTAGGLAMVAAVALGATSALPLVLSIALYLGGMGLVQPQTIAGAMAPYPERAGAASSLVGVAQMGFAAIVGAVVGHTLGASAWPLALPVAAMGLATLLLWALSRGVRARAKPQHH